MGNLKECKDIIEIEEIMKIRKANITDIEGIAKLFDAYRIFYRKKSDIKAANNYLSQRLNNKDSEIYVCEIDEGELVGFVQLYPLFSSTRMKKYWLLNDLFVAHDHRGKGISIQLIEMAKQLVIETSACGMFLETEKSNIIGNNLYPKTGFKLIDAVNYYEWTNE